MGLSEMQLRHTKIANALAVGRMVLHTNKVADIAETLRYSPILIVNALHQGAKVGKFDYDHKKGLIDLSKDIEVEKLSLPEDLIKVGGIDLREEIEQLIYNSNTSQEADISAEELMTWVPGSTDTQIKMLAYTSDKLAMYDVTDPDDKESTYTFLTLKENADKRWGEKQFRKKK